MDYDLKLDKWEYYFGNEINMANNFLNRLTSNFFRAIPM